MSPIGDATWSLNATAQNAAWRARALQKPSSASDLHGEQQDQPQRHRRASKTTTRHRQMHHSGTGSHVPFRHAARLTAPFTAQLLGQIMPDPGTPSVSRGPLCRRNAAPFAGLRQAAVKLRAAPIRPAAKNSSAGALSAPSIRHNPPHSKAAAASMRQNRDHADAA